MDIPTASDCVLRAMTDDGAFRVMVARTTDTARSAVEAQRVEGFAAHQLGELITASVLVRETMSPPNRVQVVLADDADNLIVGDAWPEGHTRGLAQVKDRALGVDLDLGGSLRVERALPRGSSHRGVVQAPREGGLDAALTSYFTQSEQIATFVALACVTDPGSGDLAAAGGYVVQLLPELTEPPLAAMRSRLQEFGGLQTWLRRHGDDPQVVLDALLATCTYTPLAHSPVAYRCHCTRTRAVGAAAALGRDDLRNLAAQGETLRIHCDYCRTLYELGPGDFLRILDGDD
ncbi:MAG: Hsp33 family molecular chaperone HslO [Planctomycetota bacterium]